MKKILFSIGVALLFSFGAVAQTITLPWNQYDPSNIAYQGWQTTKLAGYVPAVNDVVTVHVVGTASEDMEDFLMAVVDDRPAVDYWGQYSDMPSLKKGIAKGVEFDLEVDIVISTLTQADKGKPSFGTALSNPKIVLVGKNSVLGTVGTSITLNFTTFDVSFFSPWPGASVLTGSDDRKQSTGIQGKVTEVELNDVLRVTITGSKTDVDADGFEVALVDATEAGGWWKELTNWIKFTPEAVKAGNDFTLVADVKVLQLPDGTGAKSLEFYVAATTSGKLIQIENFNMTVEKIDNPGETLVLPWNEWGSSGVQYQGKETEKLAGYTPAVGDEVTVRIAGTADFDISGLLVTVIDDRKEVGNWGEFSTYGTLGDVTQGAAFDFTVKVEILAVDKAGTPLMSPKLVFMGDNAALAGANGTGTKITIALDALEVQIKSVGVQAVAAAPSVKVYAIEGGLAIEGAEKAVVYGIDGSVIATATGKIALPKGVYIVKVDGKAIKAIVK